MTKSSRSLRWLQIALTLFYGQVISTGVYEYIIPGTCGLVSRLRPTYDCILLIILGLLMFGFVAYATVALWYCQARMSVVSVLILIGILALTLAKSIVDVLSIGRHPTRAEWITIRITELTLRVVGILAGMLFIMRLRQGYQPESF